MFNYGKLARSRALPRRGAIRSEKLLGSSVGNYFRGVQRLLRPSLLQKWHMVSTSIRSMGWLYLDRKGLRGGSDELLSFSFLIGTSPCAVMRGTRRGKQKGALPEMASGTLPLLRRFGSKRDELITHEVYVHQAREKCTLHRVLLLLIFDDRFLQMLPNSRKFVCSFFSF